MSAKPSPTELALLKVLWRKESALSAREIHDTASLDWSPSSTRKTLDRMEEKGLVAAEDAHGVKVYAPTSGKVETLARMTRDFAAQVFDMDAALPVSAFAQSPLLDADDLAALEALLDEAEDDTDHGETKA